MGQAAIKQKWNEGFILISKDYVEFWEWIWGGDPIQQEGVQLSTSHIFYVCSDVLLSFGKVMINQEKLLTVSIMSFV